MLKLIFSATAMDSHRSLSIQKKSEELLARVQLRESDGPDLVLGI